MNQTTPTPEGSVTRLEIIGSGGRLWTNYSCSVKLVYQDDNRTLKVFVTDKALDETPHPWLIPQTD